MDTDILNDYRAWIYKLAWNMTADAAKIQDLAQEGWIAMWKALQSYDSTKGSLPSWLTYKARNRMLTVVASESWTGRPDRHQGRGKLTDIKEYASSDESLWGLMAAPDLLTAAELAYHEGEIAQAISELSPAQQKYVKLKFWSGYQRADMIEEFGYDPTSLWNSPKNGAKKKLKESLAHLSTV